MLRPLFGRYMGACRFMSTINGTMPDRFINRNPRNLERLRIGYKPDGYHLEKSGRCYWHKISLDETKRYVTAYIKHFENGVVVKASTAEWCMKEQLYSGNDINAYYCLGQVLADRCLMCGLTEVFCNIEASNPEGKVASFLRALKEGGVCLQEPPQFKPARPWDQDRPEKPWEVTTDE